MGARHGPAFLCIAMIASACSLEQRPSLGRHEPMSPPAFGPTASVGSGAIDSGLPIDRAGVSSAGAAAPVLPMRTQRDVPALTEPGADAQVPLEPPDAAGNQVACTTGTYVGAFSCALDPSVVPPVPPPPPGLPPSMTTEVVLALGQVASGDTLELAPQALRFTYGGLAFSGVLRGRLDCVTDTFHADIVDGIATPMFGSPFPQPISFYGAIEGQLDRGTETLTGSWWHGPGDWRNCVGTWSANAQP